MTILVLSLLIGVVAGLRAMTAPAAVAWAAHLGGLSLAGTPLAFMGHVAALWVFGVLALGELVTDQLPKTPSRKVPVQFGTRIVMGALCGATLAAPGGQLVVGAIAGAVGAVIGTLGGAAAAGEDGPGLRPRPAGRPDRGRGRDRRRPGDRLPGALGAGGRSVRSPSRRPPIIRCRPRAPAAGASPSGPCRGQPC